MRPGVCGTALKQMDMTEADDGNLEESTCYAS